VVGIYEGGISGLEKGEGIKFSEMKPYIYVEDKNPEDIDVIKLTKV
jgi:hypothetical protein